MHEKHFIKFNIFHEKNMKEPFGMEGIYIHNMIKGFYNQSMGHITWNGDKIKAFPLGEQVKHVHFDLFYST